MAASESIAGDRIPVSGASWPMGAALFSAIGLLVRRPILWLTWSLLSIATAGLTILATYYAQQIPPLFDIASATTRAEWGPVFLDRAWRQILTLPAFAVGYGISMAAYLRAELEPDRRSISFIKLGRTELRIGLSVLAVLAAVDLGLAAVGLTAIKIAPAGGGVTIGILLLYLATFLTFAWVVSQLWLGPADILARGSVSLARIWRLATGRRTRLFWSFVLAGLISVLFLSLGQYLAAIIWAKIEHQPIPSLAASIIPGDRQVASPYHGANWLETAAYSVFGSVGFACLICPTAFIYRTLSPKVEEVF